MPTHRMVIEIRGKAFSLDRALTRLLERLGLR